MLKLNINLIDFIIILKIKLSLMLSRKLISLTKNMYAPDIKRKFNQNSKKFCIICSNNNNNNITT